MKGERMMVGQSKSQNGQVHNETSGSKDNEKDNEKRGISEEEQVSYRQAIPKFMLDTPYIKGMGVLMERYVPDEATMRLPFRDDLTNDGTYYHGGVVAAVMDTAGAAAVWSNHDFNKGTRASTVAMSIQYVGACKKSDLICHAKCIKRGKELSFSEITATDVDGNVVAHAVQTYRIV